MDALLLIARLALAAVFAVAGVGKLLDLDGSVEAVRAFHLPGRLARPVGLGLPVVELATALLLLPSATAWVGALLAALLLGGFLAGIANSLRLGEAPDCHCFGQIHSEPVGPRAIGRNATLLVVALFVLVEGYTDPGSSPFGALADLSALEATMLIGLAVALTAVVVEGWLIAHLLRQSGRFLLAVDELQGTTPTERPVAAETPVGRLVPVVEVEDLDGRRQPLAALLERGRKVMLVFSDPTCGPCAALRPEVRRWQTEHASRLTIAVVSRGEAEANRLHAAEHGLERVYLESERAVSAAFGVTGTPAAVLISAEGRIESEVAGGAAAIRALVAKTTARPTIPLNGTPRPPAAGVGQVAPAITLPNLDGERVNLDTKGDRDTVMLFWNPGCGFCQRLLPELVEWDSSVPTPERPGLVVVSTGDRDVNRAAGLRSTVLLDEGFATGRRFGASGTPSAVRIGADGRIASSVAVGGTAVMALLATSEGAELSATSPTA